MRLRLRLAATILRQDHLLHIRTRACQDIFVHLDPPFRFLVQRGAFALVMGRIFQHYVPRAITLHLHLALAPSVTLGTHVLLILRLQAGLASVRLGIFAHKIVHQLHAQLTCIQEQQVLSQVSRV
jgi:hypothetical protein